MKKLLSVFFVISLFAFKLSARGGSGDFSTLEDAKGVVSRSITTASLGDTYVWSISTNQNRCLKISYNVRLGAGDSFTISSARNRQVTYVDFSCSGANDETFTGEIYTTNPDGTAFIELLLCGRPDSEIDDYVQFSYELSPSISCNNLIVDGNVGIGTGDPTCKLDVRGTMRANEILVNIPSGADFVFDPSYQLAPLDELSSYLETNRHLPGIQSAEEMETEGVSVNDLQIKLLQKVEELTLYIIRQQERIHILEKEINCSKKK